jgi:hypothetical protein
MDELLFNLISDGVPIDFYPYAHTVYHRLGRYSGQLKYEDLRNSLIMKFKNAGISVHKDNKTAFGLMFHDHKIYIGFYDWTIYVGFDIRKV